MRRRCLAALMLVLGTAAACEHQAGVQTAAVTVAPPPAGGDDEAYTSADLAAVPRNLADNIDWFNGRPPRMIRAALGDPSFRRRDKGVEIWQYYGDGCVLDLFVYRDKDARQVKHFALRSTGGGPATSCFRGIVDSRRQAATQS